MSSLEDKFDRHKEKYNEDMTEVKVRLSGVETSVENMSEKLDDTNQVIKDHVAGDNKIIIHLEPMLPHLAAMAEDYNYKKQKKQKRKEFIENWRLHIGFSISVITLASLLWGFFG